MFIFTDHKKPCTLENLQASYTLAKPDKCCSLFVCSSWFHTGLAPRTLKLILCFAFALKSKKTWTLISPHVFKVFHPRTTSPKHPYFSPGTFYQITPLLITNMAIIDYSTEHQPPRSHSQSPRFKLGRWVTITTYQSPPYINRLRLKHFLSIAQYPFVKNK